MVKTLRLRKTDGSVTLSQEFDVLSAIAEFPGIADMRPVDTPMETNFLGVAKTKVADTDAGGVMERDAEFPYRGAIGHALWFARRNFPDILSAVTILASATAAPTRHHVKGVKRLLKYLHGHATQTITLARDATFDPKNILITSFTDADWAADPLKRRSMSGYVLLLVVGVMFLIITIWLIIQYTLHQNLHFLLLPVLSPQPSLN